MFCILHLVLQTVPNKHTSQFYFLCCFEEISCSRIIDLLAARLSVAVSHNRSADSLLRNLFCYEIQLRKPHQGRKSFRLHLFSVFFSFTSGLLKKCVNFATGTSNSMTFRSRQWKVTEQKLANRNCTVQQSLKFSSIVHKEPFCL